MVLTGALLDLTPLRSAPGFRRLWVGWTLAGFGTQMTLVAVLFQVWQRTGSPVWTGVVAAAQAVPVVAVGLLAGAVVDRVDRRRFYLVAVTGQAVCSALLVVQAFLDAPIGVVLVIFAAQSGFAAARGPAARTFVARLLPTSQQAAGLALNRISFQAAMLLGPALGGLLVGAVGVQGCYLVEAVTFAAAFRGAFGLPPMRPEGAGARPGPRGVLDGLAFLGRQPLVRAALLTDLCTTALSMPISLFPLVNAERFGGDPGTLGLFLSAVAFGGVVASVFSGTFTRLPRPERVMVWGSGCWGAALVLFGLVPLPWVGLACLAVAGAADTVAVVSRGTIVQQHTPSDLLGRVVAAEQIAGRAGPDLGNLRGGLLAEATSGTTALVSGGVLCVVAVTWIAARMPRSPGTPVPEATP